MQVCPLRRSLPKEIPAKRSSGDPAESGTDLLVMGSIGRTGLEKIMLGSVAEKVVRHSKVPVLIVPGKSDLKI